MTDFVKIMRLSRLKPGAPPQNRGYIYGGTVKTALFMSEKPEFYGTG
jgi:hypothetical protein